MRTQTPNSEGDEPMTSSTVEDARVVTSRRAPGLSRLLLRITTLLAGMFGFVILTALTAAADDGEKSTGEPGVGSLVGDTVESVVETTVPANDEAPADSVQDQDQADPPANEAPAAETAPPAEPVNEPVAKKVVEPVAEEVTEPVAEQVIEPVAEEVAKPVAKKVIEPVVAEVLEPVTDTVLEVTDEVIAPLTGSTVRPLLRAIEPIGQPVLRVAQSVTDGLVPLTDPFVEDVRPLSVTVEPLADGQANTVSIQTAQERSAVRSPVLNGVPAGSELIPSMPTPVDTEADSDRGVAADWMVLPNSAQTAAPAASGGSAQVDNPSFNVAVLRRVPAASDGGLSKLPTQDSTFFSNRVTVVEHRPG